jgi:hypothetical protein
MHIFLFIDLSEGRPTTSFLSFSKVILAFLGPQTGYNPDMNKIHIT